MLILDTGPILAAADRNESDHDACSLLLQVHAGPLVITELVVAEAAYLISRQLGPSAEIALCDGIVSGSIQVEPLLAADWARMRELVAQYVSLSLGGTDASVIAIAERLRATEVATLDRRHFSVVRPKHVNALNLLPE